MYCQNCNSYVPDGTAFCSTCGSPVQNQGYQQQSGYQQPGYQQPGYQQPGYGYQQPGYNYKSKMAVLLLASFLGHLGIHNFYLGHTSRAVLQLLLTLLLSWTVVVPLGIWIWAIVEGINAMNGKIFDANGQPLIG